MLDSLRVWREEGADEVGGQAGEMCRQSGKPVTRGLLRIEHYLHLRCEVPMPKVVDDATALIDLPEVRLMSLMDHMPGQRQFRDPVKLREYYRGKSGGLSDSEFDVLFARRIENHARHAACNYRGLLDLATGGRSRSQAMMTRRPTT